MIAALTAVLLSISNVGCPTSEAVERRLSTLRSPDAVALWYRVEVSRVDDTLVLKAVTSSGDTRLERTLPANGPCDELEQAAAVVLFAWEVQLPPGSVPVPTLEKPAPAVVVPARVRVSAEGQLWLSSASPTWGLGGVLDVRLGRSAFFLTLEALGQGTRSVVVGDGRASWSRFSVALGPSASFAFTSQLELDAMLGVLGGPFFIQGADFTAANNNLTDWDIGLTLQARLLLPGLWKVRPYVGISSVLWLRRHQAVETVSAHTVDLPWLEASPTLGLALFL